MGTAPHSFGGPHPDEAPGNHTASAYMQRPPPPLPQPPAAPDPRGGPVPARPPADVKPRLTKEQHEILEQHFQEQNKPSTSTKRDFASRLGVSLDKINNWFQNRRAKSKQEEKKRQNAQQEFHNIQNLYGRPHMAATGEALHAGHAGHPGHPALQYNPNPLPQVMQYQPGAPVNPPMHYAANPNSALDPSGGSAPAYSSAPPYWEQYPLGSIPEADRSSYNPSGVNITFMTQAAARGPSYMPESQQQSQVQLPAYLDGPATWPSNDLALAASSFSGPSGPSEVGLDNQNFGHTSGSYLETAEGLSQDVGSRRSIEATDVSTASSQMTSSTVDALTSRFSGYQAPDDKAEENFGLELPSSLFGFDQPWTNAGEPQNMASTDMYQQSDDSGPVAPDTTPQDQQLLSPENPYSSEHPYSRRNSSTTNLTSNIEAINLAPSTSSDHLFTQPVSTSTIAARRRKGPPGLNPMAMRSASYTSLTSPTGSHDHTLRRIKSSGISNAGRIHKAQPGSAQRSPMTATFAEAAASPKFALAFSSNANSANVVPSLSTPQTPNETGGEAPFWAGSSSLPNESGVTGLNGRSTQGQQSLWPANPGWMENPAASASPPTTPLSYVGLTTTTWGGDTYRNTPPQSAPATQVSFQYTQWSSHNRPGNYSTTDLTVPQSNSPHQRRPSFHGTVHTQANLHHPTLQDLIAKGGFNDDMPTHHDVPFAPAYQDPTPWESTCQQAMQPFHRAKNYIFANQSAADFQS